jgi:hypothetical protein
MEKRKETKPTDTLSQFELAFVDAVLLQLIDDKAIAKSQLNITANYKPETAARKAKNKTIKVK